MSSLYSNLEENKPNGTVANKTRTLSPSQALFDSLVDFAGLPGGQEAQQKERLRRTTRYRQSSHSMKKRKPGNQLPNVVGIDFIYFNIETDL